MGQRTERDTIVIGLTPGDPAGIGPEIALRAWQSRLLHQLPPFAVYAAPELLRERSQTLGLLAPLKVCQSPEEAISCFSEALPVIPIPLAAAPVPGKPDNANASATIAAIDRAVADCAAGRSDAVVTNPIAKAVLYEAGFQHPGHTEYLAELSGRFWPAQPRTAVMMLTCEHLRIIPLTVHVALNDVPALITRKLIIQTAHVAAASLASDFGIDKPRIAIAGLNPHAGESGALGREERDIIAPAVLDLQRDGLTVSGPYPADTMFHAAARARYDVAIAMYHDQALIPVKTLAFDEGVNITLGLPFVRTSPDHGTAFDIAAEGRASAKSLIAAIQLAGIVARRRAKLHT